MEDNVINLNQNIGNAGEIEIDSQQINSQLEQDPVVQKALKITKANELVIKEFVDETMAKLVEMVESKEHPFSVRHAFQALSRCNMYVSQMLCDNAEDFKSEVTKANECVVAHMLPAIPDADIANFSLKRLMMLSSAIVDNVFWREALGESVPKEEAEILKSANKVE